MVGSEEEVMVLEPEKEDETVTLDESSIASLLAGAGVTITRNSGGFTPKPNGSSLTKITGSGGKKETTAVATSTPIRKPGHSSSRTSRSLPSKGLPVTIKKRDPDVDPLDLGDEDMEVEYEKIDTLRQILAKSSVAITYQGQRPGSSGRPQKKKTSDVENTRSSSTPPLSSKILNGTSTQPQRSLSLNPKKAIMMKHSGLKSPAARVKAKTPLKPTPKRPAPPASEKLKPAPRVPKLIDRGPIDCFDSLIVETDMGFPCNFCEVPQSFPRRRGMIGHLQKDHPEELSEEQSNPDLTGLFPCEDCGTVFHSKFIQRTHRKAHKKIGSGACDKYFRYYLSFGQLKA